MNAKPCPFCEFPWRTMLSTRVYARCLECGSTEIRASASDADFDAWWMRTPIPAEYDSWDECARQQWRAVCRSAFEAGATAAHSPTFAAP